MVNMVLILGILIYRRLLEYFPEFYIIYLSEAVLFAVLFSDGVPKETTRVYELFTSIPEIPC